MNSFIQNVNLWGERFLGFAWPMLCQSSVLIAVLFTLDLALRRKVRAAIRHALWLVVLVKLLLPPAFALPTGPAWWLRPRATAPVKPQTSTLIVTYGPAAQPRLPDYVPPVSRPPQTPVPTAGKLLLTWGIVCLGLLGWMFLRWIQVARDLRRAAAAPERVGNLLKESWRAAGLRRCPRLRLTDRAMSPAVCGLFRPVILLPRLLAEQLAPEQLRAILMHELIHLRRGDLWVNCAQTLLQTVYWWHPLLWLANARIRRVREEAVDDAVMLALREDAERYAPTLLEVAKLALNRPLTSLGLVGILEPKSALRQRIERLVNFPTPRRAGLSVVSLLGIAAFTAVAVPMGEAPPKSADTRIGQFTAKGTESGPAQEVMHPNAVTNSNKPAALAANQPGTLTLVRDPNGQSVQVVSGTSVFDVRTRTLTASNDVVLRHGDVVMTADTIEFNQRSGVFTANNGHIRIQAGDNVTTAQPQINIKTMFVEVPEECLRDFLGSIGATNALSESSKPQFAVVFSASQFGCARSRLELRKDVRVISEGQVTTLNARQCQIQTIDDFPPILFEGTNGLVQTNVIRPNSSVDIIPTIETDGRTIQMTLTPTVMEFLGYDDPGPFVVESNAAGVLRSPGYMIRALPMPRFLVRKMGANVRVWDGDTLMLGGPTVTEVRGEKTVSPPKTLREDSKHHLLVFITPTLIDSNGNRVHPDDTPVQFDQILPEDSHSSRR